MKAQDNFRAKLNRLTATLEKFKDFFRSGEPDRQILDYYAELENETGRFNNAISMSVNEAKTLRIGIVGAMKAGKSSFLNMLLFDGKEVLPRAATPMTAALTRITHSPDKDCHIVVHFYSKDDWMKVQEKAGEYDSKLRASYNEYKDNLEKENRDRMQTTSGMPPALCNPVNITQYEYKMFKDYSVFEQSAKQLVDSYGSSVGLEERLGTEETLEGEGSNLNKILEPYVGANGKFTPIVNYVELSIPLDNLDGVEIVDMPGLGDPIISRSQKTKDFAKECDVILYFSKCQSFMDAQDLNDLNRLLPSSREKMKRRIDGFVIASRFDGAVTSYRGKMQLIEAIARVREDVRLGFSKGLELMPEELRRRYSWHLLYSSALADSIMRKRQCGAALSEDEKANYDNLLKMNGGRGLSDKELVSLSGINPVRKALRGIVDKKEELLQGKQEDKIEESRNNVLSLLAQLLEHVQNTTHKLETIDIEDARKKKKEVERALDGAATRIGSHFTAAALSARKVIENLDAELLGAVRNFEDLKVDRGVKHHSEKRHEGFFGLRTVHYDYTITTYSLATAQIDEQVLSFASYCAQRVNRAFDLIVNIDELKRSVTDEVLTALQDASFTEEDILAPLRIAFAKIKLPKLDVDPHEYLDRIHSEYPEGVAKGDDIHKAKTLLISLLSDVQQDISAKLDKNKETIAAILDKESAGFATGIRARMSGDIDRLEAECANKEKNLKMRRKFIDELHLIQESIAR